MSKKTIAEKQKRLTTRPRRRAHQRKRINVGPRKPIKRDANVTTADLLFADVEFMHHLAHVLFRAMELTGELPPPADNEFVAPHDLDAEFIAPKGVKPE